ncbi:MAG: hypothetical protein R3B45_15845 [Bdellovibrionota bacterium]
MSSSIIAGLAALLLTSTALAQRGRVPGGGRVSLPGSTPYAATLIFYSEGLWGDQYSYTLKATSTKEASVAIPDFTLRAKNLLHRISTAKLICGQVSATVGFFDGDNSTTNMETWGGNYHAISCEPGNTTTVDFHSIQARPSMEDMGDKVTSAFMIVNSRPYNDFPFSMTFKNNWDAEINDTLGDNAEPRGDVQLTWINTKTFKLRQNVRIKISLWPDYDAWFEYIVTIGTKQGTGPNAEIGPANFRIVKQNIWVAPGRFHDRVKFEFNREILSSHAEFEQRLNESFAPVFGQNRTYYFVPGYTIDQFFAAYGG